MCFLGSVRSVFGFGLILILYLLTNMDLGVNQLGLSSLKFVQNLQKLHNGYLHFKSKIVDSCVVM